MKIPHNSYSPKVEISKKEMNMIGNLWMEDPSTFFNIIKEEITKINPKSFKINLSINHINSSSIKQLFEFLKFAKSFIPEALIILWSCPDDDKEMDELIKDIGNILDLNINVFMVPEKELFYK